MPRTRSIHASRSAAGTADSAPRKTVGGADPADSDARIRAADRRWTSSTRASYPGPARLRRFGAAIPMRLATALVFVKDLARMTAFYRDALGLRLVPGASEDGWVELDAGGARLGLHAIPPAYADHIVI